MTSVADDFSKALVTKDCTVPSRSANRTTCIGGCVEGLLSVLDGGTESILPPAQTSAVWSNVFDFDITVVKVAD